MNSSRSTLEHMTTVLMGLPFAAALMDGEGTYLAVNGSWVSQDDYYPASGMSSGPGGNLPALCLYAGTPGPGRWNCTSGGCRPVSRCSWSAFTTPPPSSSNATAPGCST